MSRRRGITSRGPGIVLAFRQSRPTPPIEALARKLEALKRTRPAVVLALEGWVDDLLRPDGDQKGSA